MLSKKGARLSHWIQVPDIGPADSFRQRADVERRGIEARPAGPVRLETAFGVDVWPLNSIVKARTSGKCDHP